MPAHPTIRPGLPSLLGMATAELASVVADLGQPAYRANQLAAWLYRHGVGSFDEMTNLGRELRADLAERFSVGAAEVVEERVSSDGCRKLLLELADGCLVETVLLPYPDRTAVCVSTQVGCPVRCPFCATGLSGYTRDLTAGEIVEQVVMARRRCRPPATHSAIRNPQSAKEVTHVVFMGMGEPLLNYDATLKAVRLLAEEVGMGMRRMTISTVGIVPAMDRLAAEELQLTLAVSLHAPDDELRARLVPLARKYPLTELREACLRYLSQTGRRLTFEYVLLKGINDSPAQAKATAALVKPLHAAVNLIPYNAVDGASEFQRPTTSPVRRFREILERAGVTVTERVERGADIAGACGQLRRQAARSHVMT